VILSEYKKLNNYNHALNKFQNNISDNNEIKYVKKIVNTRQTKRSNKDLSEEKKVKYSPNQSFLRNSSTRDEGKISQRHNKKNSSFVADEHNKSNNKNTDMRSTKFQINNNYVKYIDNIKTKKRKGYHDSESCVVNYIVLLYKKKKKKIFDLFKNKKYINNH
jgi:hypothetical protein